MATLATTFAWCTFTCRSLCALATFATLSACRAGFALTQFVAAIRAGFATTAAFAGGANFALSTFAAFTAAAIASATTTITALAITTTFAATLTALTIAAFAGFFIFMGNGCWRCFSGTATEQVFQPAKETT
jgi:hypothetical protein